LAIGLVVALSASPAKADVLVAQTLQGTIARYDELTGEVISGWGITVAAPSPDGTVAGLAVSAAGVLYVSNRNEGTILHYDVVTGAPIGAGLFATLPDNPPIEPEGDPVQAGPGTLKIGPDGLLYVADNTGTRIHRYNTATGALVDTPVSGLSGVGGIGFASNGKIISTDFFPDFDGIPNQNAVYFDTGTPPSQLVPAAFSTLTGPNGLLVNDDDSFWVADLFSNRVVKFDSGGIDVDSIDIPFPEDVDPQNLPTGSFGPINFGSDLVLTPSGELLVATLGVSAVERGASKNYGELLRYDTEGELIGRLATSQPAIGALTLVAGLVTLPGDYDRDGDVDPDDYARWRSAYGGQVTPLSSADGNGDGVIDAADYTVWRDNLPGVVEMTASAAPEPAAALLLLGGLVGGALGRRR
jgi:sugar lactone lactonase YvrE